MRRLSGLETGAMAMVMSEGHDEGKMVKLLYWDHRKKAWWTTCKDCGRHGGGDFMAFYAEENLK